MCCRMPSSSPSGAAGYRCVSSGSIRTRKLTVSDTGVGIPAEFLPHVFDRFRQADAGISRARGGLGLGLAITRHLVELQGGRIFADSDGLGKGATFRIELPLRSAKPQARSKNVSIRRRRGARIRSSCRNSTAFAFWRSTTTATPRPGPRDSRSDRGNRYDR